MNKIQKATNQMLDWASDPRHGYDQSARWGPDFDCSSAVIQAWQLAGVPVKSSGATYTGNMYSVFLRNGFEDVTAAVNLSSGAGLQLGDVLLNHRSHAAMYCGNGQTVEASINEHGTVTGGAPGDQTGREFLVRAYRNYPWNCVLRYTGESSAAQGEPSTAAPSYFYSVRLPLLKPGMASAYVGVVQMLLEALQYYSGDLTCEMDDDTVEAVKQYQRAAGLLDDGEVGGQTWTALLRYK